MSRKKTLKFFLIEQKQEKMGEISNMQPQNHDTFSFILSVHFSIQNPDRI